MQLNPNYHDCKLEVKAIMDGSLSSFLWAYCKTVSCPTYLEPYFIRKVISFSKLSKYVRVSITNDFDNWYRINKDSSVLNDVVAAIINTEESRTEVYCQYPGRKSISKPFKFTNSDLEFVLVQGYSFYPFSQQ
jgi:hypothetical protein